VKKEALGVASEILMSISKDDHERAKFRSRRKYETDLFSNIATAEARGEKKRSKETAFEMFGDGENIAKIKKYSKLNDAELAEVLREFPADIQNKYSFLIT